MSSKIDPSSRSRTILWCVPRSASTSLTKCLSSIEECEIWLEPYCFSHIAMMEYAHHFGGKLPTDREGNEEVCQKVADKLTEIAMTRYNPDYISYGSVKRLLERSTSPHVFVKDIGYGCDDGIRFLPEGFKHTFLIRHPWRVLPSYRRAMYKLHGQLGEIDQDIVTEDKFDLKYDSRYCPDGYFFGELYKIWKHVCTHLDSQPVVIDGDDLLRNPAEILPKYCRAVGLPYKESMLRWEGSLRPMESWKVPSAQHLTSYKSFYQRTIDSTKFIPPGAMPSRSDLTPDIIRCADEVMELYEEMNSHRIRLDQPN
ncbi:uncharacterized protein [Diadema setosum]|uniref:uncharacterized protein n=1 Tax=Diadema setosum TaxID=31175 RepID=UPI003B3B6ED9